MLSAGSGGVAGVGDTLLVSMTATFVGRMALPGGEMALAPLLLAVDVFDPSGVEARLRRTCFSRSTVSRVIMIGLLAIRGGAGGVSTALVRGVTAGGGEA